MRTTLLVLSTLAIVAACSQDSSTSPASRGTSPSARASLDANPNSDSPPGPTNGAKPAPAFTTITQITSDQVSWDGVNKIYGAAVAMCPAGSHVTGGGYLMYGGPEVTIGYNGPFGEGWRIYGVSHSSASITAYALCAQ